MSDRKQADDAKDLPLAGEHELHQEPPPARADALDEMRRRLAGTPSAPEQPTNIAPESKREGQHASVDDGGDAEFPGRGRE